MIKKKKFLEECKILPRGIHKVEQTPSEKMQDELEPIDEDCKGGAQKLSEVCLHFPDIFKK